MHGLLYPGLRHCGSPKPLWRIWGWGRRICWAGKELWEICRGSCRSHLQQRRSTFWLLLSHKELGCSTFLIHFYAKESKFAWTAWKNDLDLLLCCHTGRDGGSAVLLKRGSRATPGSKILKPPKWDAGKPVLGSTAGGQHGGAAWEAREEVGERGRGEKGLGRRCWCEWGGRVSIPLLQARPWIARKTEWILLAWLQPK